MSASASTKGKKVYSLPVVTWALIGLSVAVYAAIAANPREDQLELYKVFGLTAQDPSFRNMLTSLFLHSDPLHLATNMVFLWIFGRGLERALGVVGYLLLYVGSGLFASVTHLAIVWAFMPAAAAQPSLGASGAIAGILGVYAIRFFRTKLRFVGIEVHPPVLLLVWLILQVFLGMLSLYIDDPRLKSVDYWSHMGGFAFGIVVAYFTKMASVGRREYLLNDAEDSFLRGTLLDVVRKYEALLRYDKQDPFTNAELGRTWALLEDDEQAIPYYKAAIDAYLAAGRDDEAYARYQEMLRLMPECALDSETVGRLARRLEETGRDSEALALLSKDSNTEQAADGKPSTPSGRRGGAS